MYRYIYQSKKNGARVLSFLKLDSKEFKLIEDRTPDKEDGTSRDKIDGDKRVPVSTKKKS